MSDEPTSSLATDLFIQTKVAVIEANQESAKRLSDERHRDNRESIAALVAVTKEIRSENKEMAKWLVERLDILQVNLDANSRSTKTVLITAFVGFAATIAGVLLTHFLG